MRTKQFLVSVVVLTTILLFSPIVSLAQMKVFLKVDGMPGDSIDDTHKDWIDILGVGSGVILPIDTLMPGGIITEKPTFKDIEVIKYVDKATPKLLLACAEGTIIKQVIIEFCQSTGDKHLILQFKLSNGIVSKVASSFDQTSKKMTEIVSFKYAKIEWTCWQFNTDTGEWTSVSSGWDLFTNQKV
jgi:type VI secretion system secreted protein Hcp